MSAKASLPESELIDRLRTKYGALSGNGAEYAFIPKVRSAAAFDARRTIDAYAMSLWPSRGLSLTAFEIKSSRSDWQRELKNPAKAEEFCERADYFYLVVGDAAIIRPGELPETWGLIVPHGKGLRVEVTAPRLRSVTVDGAAPSGRPVADLPPSLDRSFLAALLRSATAVGAATPEAIVEAEQRVRDHYESLGQARASKAQALIDKLLAERREFEQAAGVPLTKPWQPSHSPRQVGNALKAILRGDADVTAHENRLRSLRRTAAEVVGIVDRQLGEESL